MLMLNLSKICLLLFLFHNKELICSFTLCSKMQALAPTPQLFKFCPPPIYLKIPPLCATLTLQSCLLITIMNVTFISTFPYWLILFLVPKMLSIYKTHSSNLTPNLANHSSITEWELLWTITRYKNSWSWTCYVTWNYYHRIDGAIFHWLLIIIDIINILCMK